MAKQDYYDLLGVAKDAPLADIKKAYRRLAMKYHPDRNPDDKKAEDKFREASEAYEVLKDDQKRAAYDRYGHAAFEGGAGGGPGAGGFDFGGGGGFGGFADIFEEMFGDVTGRGGRQAGPSRGADIRYNMEVTLEEAFKGVDKKIRTPSLVSCETCSGSGAEKGSSPVSCKTCQGIGKVRVQQGFFTLERACPDCHGSGQIIKKPCKDCHGAGRINETKNLEVHVPAGIEDGTRIRLAGEGEAGMNNAGKGDMYLFISVKPHPIFERDNANIHCAVPVPMAVAALGGDIEVPTIEGKKVKLTLPEGTQSGAQFRLRGKGMSILRRKDRGDMIVHTQIEVPTRLNKRQKELLKEFNEASGKVSHPQTEGFFSKVKEVWEDLTD